jgi:hypothetical protein
MVHDIAEGNYTRAAMAVGANLVVNVYPIMTQRYNRARIYRALGK